MHLQCTNKTNNHLNHYWLHNNSDVVIDDQRVQNMANGSLIVKRISFRDGGDYECIYTTEDPLQGVLISSYTVKVTHAPSGPSIKVQLVEFVITPENQTIIAGSTAVISCEAHYEDGLLDTGWQRGGEVLSNSSVVVIPRAAIMDGGEYVCVVANTGLKNSTFLNVHGMSHSSPYTGTQCTVLYVMRPMRGCAELMHSVVVSCSRQSAHGTLCNKI